MKILWLSWKDIRHPQAGGAEVVASELGKRLARDGHEVTFVTGGFSGGAREETIDGYNIIRLGNRVSVYWHTWRYVRQHLRDWPDIVIEEVNTIPFFSRFYIKKPRLLLFHMLCRKIWFYQLPWPLGLIGFIAEPMYLRLINKDTVMTVSSSTKHDLMRHGFKAERITVISEGSQLKPVENLSKIRKYARPTVLSLGALRAMKRTMHQIEAFEAAKADIPDLQLLVAGDAQGSYGQKVLEAINESPYSGDIEYLGKVSNAEKLKLMQRAHTILVTSVKEGWGLIVTEAASQGTPAVVYNVDGLRDSVRDNWSGFIATKNTPQHMSLKIKQLLSDKSNYRQLQENGWTWSKQINFDQCYKDAAVIINQTLIAKGR